MQENEARLRSRIRQALSIVEPDPGLRARVIDSMPIDIGGGVSRWQWAAGGIAVLLAVTTVAGLIFVRKVTSVHPAASGQFVGSLNMTTQLGFRCTLPVTSYMTEARVSLPDGGVTVDQTQSLAGKGGPGYGTTYAAGRWLPVQAAAVSPDGGSYAYSTTTSGVPGEQPTSAVFVHDIATGKNRQLWSGQNTSQVVGWGPGGIYFSRLSSSVPGPPSAEMWVVDPANPGAAHRLASNPAPQPSVGTISRTGGGAAWAISYGQVGKPTGDSVPSPPPSEIKRMDLRDGSLSTWFTAPEGVFINLAGTDAQGHPVLILNSVVRLTPPSPQPSPQTSPQASPTPYPPPPPRVLLLTGPNQTVEIASGSDPAFRPSQALGDSHGIWFSSPGSLWLYRNGALNKVADVPVELFPSPTPPPGLTGKGSVTAPSPPAGYPTGITLGLAGACT